VRKTTWLTPPQIAKQLAVDTKKVIKHWIKSGELKAVNVASAAGGRPRYRVDPAELARFLLSRSTTIAPKPKRKARRSEEPSYY
jgi:hypothetical protein